MKKCRRCRALACSLKDKAREGRAMKSMTYGEARQIARDLAKDTLENYWSGSYPVDPVAIARSAGIEVYSSQLGVDTWGMLVGGDNSVTMYLDKDQPLNRMRFSAAHELGHYMTHTASDERLADYVKVIPAGKGYVDKRSDAGRGNLFEVIANEYAGALLMPEQELRRMAKADDSNISIARAFRVSVDAVAYKRKILAL